MNEKEFEKIYGSKAVFRPQAVADMLDCSLSHIYNLIDRQALEVIRDADGYKAMPIRIRRASILKYLNPDSNV